MSMRSLPTEVSENILVCAAADGYPTTISAVGQTCRQLRELIYNPSDTHLWREVFLTTFDDPRDCQFLKFDHFDWGAEFRIRIWAKNYLLRNTPPLRVQKIRNLRSRTSAISLLDLSAEYDSAPSCRALETLLSIIHTAVPSTLNFTRSFDRTASLGTPSQILAFASNHTSKFPSPSAPVRPSLNITWLQTLLIEHGLPPAVSAKFCGANIDPKWDNNPEAHAFSELVCNLGHLPIRTVEEDAPPPASGPIRRIRSGHPSTPPKKDLKHDESQVTALDMSLSAQLTRARHLARRRVFNMAYLSRRRDWGPFMPVKLKSSNAGPTMDASSSSASPPLLPAQKTRRKPSPDELYPDWMWLAAARVITEGKMREEMSRSNVDANIDGLCSWENLREGAWVGKRVEECRDDELNGKLEKWEPNTKTARGDGWDWAGAEGTWRRCVCWLDYEDLSFYNDINEFDDPTLQEAILIVPLRLRVVGFSEPAVARYADRPTIHVEGEMGGAWWEEQDDDMEGDVRKVHGTVSVIADGSVRWCLYSSDEESDDDQWVSEGIQIGGVGSAIGVLGMWTGARHEEGDPLGAFWSWKVA